MLTTLNCLVALSVAAPAKPIPKGELPILYGEWALVEAVMDGEPIIILDVTRLTMTWTNKSEMITRVTTEIGTQETKGTYKLDTSKSPFEMDYIPTADSPNPRSIGIFKIEGDILTIRSNDDNLPRPTQFESTINKAGVLLKLKRVDPKAK